MAKNYLSLSGADIVKKIRSKNRGRVIANCFFLLCTLLLPIGAVYGVREEHSYLMSIICLSVFALLVWLLISSTRKALKTLSNVEESRVFRKFGSPDEIAQRISEGEAIMASNQTFITDSFIMLHGNFESFVPFEQVLLLYRKEHRTNGILDSIFLVVHDAYGDKFEYPFKLGKKHADEMNHAADAIAKKAPDCRFGYTNENLAYVSQNAKKLV